MVIRPGLMRSLSSWRVDPCRGIWDGSEMKGLDSVFFFGLGWMYDGLVTG